MIKNNRLLLALFFSTISIVCYSQTNQIRKYIVITYEQIFTKSFEGTHRTFWIIDQDSISEEWINISPLLLSGYFKGDIDTCCVGNEIDPYNSSTTKDNYLDSTQTKALSYLQKIIYSKRKKVQTISKKWNSGNQETTTIYATSISGSFCLCRFSFTGQKRSGYMNWLYLPYSAIIEEETFWTTEKGKILMSTDFSKYKFDYNVLYNKFPEWRKYGK